MESLADQVRAALRQQLLGDKLLGIREVPMASPAAAVNPRVQRTAVDATRPSPTEPRTAGFARRDDGASLPTAEKVRRLRALDDTKVKGCTRCELSKHRTQTVFGQGNPDARLVFVGEGPGYQEDQQGLAFVGEAGQVLTRMIVAMGLTRDDVYICNVVKCRPPGNRTPMADEILACHPYLREQLEVIQPEMIVALGAPAAKTLLNTADAIGKLRGRFHTYYYSGVSGNGPSTPLMPTYHPAYLLRNPSDKGKVWEDLQKVMAELGLSRGGA